MEIMTDPSGGMPGMIPLSPIREVTEQGSASSGTTRSGLPPFENADSPHSPMRWYPTGGQAAVPQSEDLIDLTTDLTNPFRGFQYVPTAYAGQGAQAAATTSQYLPDHAASFFSAPPQLSSTPHGQAPSVAADTRRQETGDVNESLDFLAGAGFELSDPVLAAALQDPTLTTTLAKYVEQALVTQERARTTETSARGSTVAFADEIGSHAAGKSGGSRPQARSASSILTPSRASIHRLPQGVVGGMALNRPIGPNDKGLQHIASPGILRKGPSQEPDPQGMRSTPARALFETRALSTGFYDVPKTHRAPEN
ncbi:hypothetical protein A4X06_0g9544 [Tilletia controversa]|uniref:Uncharacterized protein n=1 Tax=Tilletia controversa TaxID=13291 RepID=A0A8X7SS43_9BASI|nr:hypothetical protein A4X06_0g9544 [Tilletia controversa]